MPSSDRPAPSRDRPEQQGAPRDGGRAKAQDAPIQPPQYFDPGEPWDAQSAEALTRLYESGEGYLPRRQEDEDARRRRPQPEAPVAASTEEPAGRNNAWLEARLAEIAERLQGSLAEINPDKAVAHLNGRLDLIEARFNEALSRVVQRSDLDGLRLIEAHVMELAAHVEHTRGRLDRIDAIDDQMQGLVRRLDDGGHQRLDALEKLLHDYIAEWRRGDERTASALHGLEDVVSRVGETIEAMEAQKPAPDLSLSLLGTPGLSDPIVEGDPLSQVYNDAARALEPNFHRSPLDAADYAPKADPAGEGAPPAQPHAPSTSSADRDRAELASYSLPSPTRRALALLAKLRQTQIQGAEAEPGEGQAKRVPTPATGPDAVVPVVRRSRSSLLLAGGLTLFAAIGYLLVDVLMATTAAPLRPVGIEHSAQDSAPAGATEHTGDVSPPREEPPRAPADGPGRNATSPSTRVARIEAIGNAMAAAFRQRDGTARPPVEATASIHQEMPATIEATQTATALPMTIGPASLRQAAMRGDPAAQLEVASRFAAGHGVERDLQQAFQWYGRAAAQGLAVAQYRFGALYERGLGTARDTERARVWYGRAAAQGNVKAMHNLAVLSASGDRSDYATAAKWFAQAADFGLTDSQVNLAILCQNGLGVPKDLAQAYKWLALAGRRGDREAAGRITQIKARLSPGEVQAADAAVAAWRARTPDSGANETAAALDADQ